MTIKEELAMSDEEFRANYLEENTAWLEHYEEYHGRCHGGVFCAEYNCRQSLTAENMRPNGGRNYCPKHFKQLAILEMKHFFGLEYGPSPQQIESFEWMMKVARVMDGGLIKLAETDDPDLD